MFPSASDAPVAPRQAPAGGSRGFSLVEMMIAVVAGGILSWMLVRFYRDSYRTYSLQDQVQERNLNAQFVVTRLTEVMQQAGSGLPDTGWSIITQSAGVTTFAVNPRNAVQFISWDPPLSQFFAVSDVSPWKNTGNVLLNFRYALIDYADVAKPCVKVRIDTSYNSSGFSKGLKDNASGMDSVRLVSSVDLSVGDRIYGYREDQYLLGGTSGTDLILRPDGSTALQMVLAENIDSLGFSFKTSAGATTTTWNQMRSATFAVRARTALPDPRYPGSYRKITLPMNVSLRNRL